MSKNKKKIDNLRWRKYELPLIIERWKIKMGYYRTAQEGYNVMLAETLNSWIEHNENKLGKIGDKISFK